MGDPGDDAEIVGDQQHAEAQIALELGKAGVTPDRISLTIHGTTLGTNAIIERRGARTALITTAGFKDTIERHGKGVNPADYADPLITTYGGGVVLRHEGRVFGAIAVSGRTPEQDHELADGARRALD